MKLGRTTKHDNCIEPSAFAIRNMRSGGIDGILVFMVSRPSKMKISQEQWAQQSWIQGLVEGLPQNVFRLEASRRNSPVPLC